MTGRDLMLRAKLRFPYATALFVLACVLTTLPLYFREELYLVIGTTGETERPTLEWRHPVTAKFVHGGGPPGTTIHLLVNTTFFIVLGSLTERLLGAGRFFLLTGAGLLSSIILTEIIADGRGHGASGMTWSYLVFTAPVLAHIWRTERARALRDPVTLVVALCFVLNIIGLVNHWHRWNLLVSLPFFFWWRGVLRDNLNRLERGEAADLWLPGWNRLGVAGSSLIFLFTSSVTLAAVLGIIR
jgi:membrane associated rhomboid family serine protease